MSVEKLKSSLIYQMSLASKELFHSNVWAWIIEKDHSIAKSVFFDLIEGENIKVTREENHRDLTIYDSTGLYIIENKIKSLADLDQLVKYQENVKSHFKGGILTGITEPTFKLPMKWIFISYEEISNRLRVSVNNSSNFSTLEKNIILEYCDVIESICLLIKDKLEAKELIFSYSGIEELELVRLADMYKKLKANDFLQYFKNNYNISKTHDIPGYNLNTWVGYNNKSSTIDIDYESSDKSLVIGVQLEAYQFRLYVKKTYDFDKQSIFEEFKGYNWFDEFYDKESRKIFDRPTTMKPNWGLQYNSYQSRKENYNFVYQYFDIQNNSSYENLSKLIINYIEKAKMIIEKYKI